MNENQDQRERGEKSGQVSQGDHHAVEIDSPRRESLVAQELDAKFMVCAGRMLPAQTASMLLATLKQLEALADTREIFRDLAPELVKDLHQRS